MKKIMRIPTIEEFAKHIIVMDANRNKEYASAPQTSHAVSYDPTSCIDVTIVTVCYNPLKTGRNDLFLKNLDSVQAQENVHLEHLIIDGASTDGTLDWLRKYNNTRYDIRILSAPDSGIYEAMNRGIALARGKYIIYLNSDDYFHDPRGMSASLARIEKLQCDFSFAPVRFSDTTIKHNPQLIPHKRLRHFIINWCFSHQSMLTSRSLLLCLDGFDTSYRSAADYDLLLRMIAAGAKGCFVPISFSTFDLGGFSCSEENAKLIEEESIHCLQSFYKYFYGVEMTHDEVEYIFNHRVYPHKYINLYKQTQKLIWERFIGIPKGGITWISRWFNYIKYYQKCRKANI